MKKILYAILILSTSIFFTSCCGTKNTKQTKQEYMAANYKLLKDTLPEAQVSLLNDTIKVLFPNNLLFNVGSSTLSSAVDPVMKKFAGALNQYQQTQILITGHTDNSGDEQMNLQLSKDRANSTKQSLLNNGVLDSRMYTWGLGDRQPLVPNTTDENKALNRRVEFVVLYIEEK